jgi:hypothetical protein
MKSLSTLFVLIAGLTVMNAQLTKVFYQDFPEEDSIFQFQFNIHEKYEYFVWEGPNVMFEVSITYKNVPLNYILESLKEGRYSVSKNNNEHITFFSTKPRWTIKNVSKNANMLEDVFIRIYMPNAYRKVSETQWDRRDDIHADSRKPLTEADLKIGKTSGVSKQ